MINHQDVPDFRKMRYVLLQPCRRVELSRGSPSHQNPWGTQGEREPYNNTAYIHGKTVGEKLKYQLSIQIRKRMNGSEHRKAFQRKQSHVLQKLH